MTTEKWLKEKILNYNKNSKEELLYLLSNTNDVIEQYINNPKSKATKSLLNSCMEHNKLFLQKIES